MRWCSSLPQAGHDRGHRVLEDIVLVPKERSYSRAKKGTYITTAVGIMQHRKERLGRGVVLRLEKRGHFREEHPPVVRAIQAQAGPAGAAVRPWFSHL